jgi:hypothetical protein
MRLVKLGLLSVFGLGGVIFLMSLLIPAESRVSRAITIAASPEKVKAELSDLTRIAEWNQLLKDSSLTGISISKEQFRADQMTVNLQQKDSVYVTMEWTRKGQPPVTGAFGITPSGADTTIVQWYFDFTVKWYPWEKFGSIIFDRQLGPPMERSLDALRKRCEQP